jgi:rhomboid family GlyGly-CTERM serine protease
LIILLGAAAGCDLGLWFLHPGIGWYVGLSGLLHGLLLGGALALVRRRRWTGLGIALLVFAKLVWEQTWGPLPGSEAMIDNRVVVEAHLYGAVGGAAAAGLGLLWPRRASVAQRQRTS